RPPRRGRTCECPRQPHRSHDAELARQRKASNINWTRQMWEAMRPYLAGAVYVNYTSDQGDESLNDAYPAQIRERLATLKSKYDPTNFFRFNQNIRPTV